MAEDSIGTRIEALMKDLGVSQAAFAKSLGTSGTRISNITQGRNKPDSQLLSAIAEEYPEVSISWLLTGKGKLYETMKTVGWERTEVFTNSAIENPYPNSNQTHNKHSEDRMKVVDPSTPGESRKAPNSSSEVENDWQKHTERTVQEVRLKTLQDYQNKLNHQLRQEDGELFRFKDNLEYLGWVFEDARRVIGELEVRYSATFFDTKKKMTYDLFKALAIRDLKRRIKYSEAIKTFSEALNEFTNEITVDKLQQDFMEGISPLDSALAVAEEDAINASVRHPDIEE